MKKIKELLKFKYLMYLLVSFSWVFLLTMVYAMNKNLEYSRSDLRAELYSIEQQLEEINNKLEYEYNSVDEGNYESIQHYRINKETGKIQKQNSWGAWSGW